jgi:hypothetical protein
MSFDLQREGERGPESWRVRLEQSRRRSTRRVIVIAFAFVLLIAGVWTYVVLVDPARVLRSARPALDAQKARYCKVFEAEKRRGTAPAIDQSATGIEPVKMAWIGFDDNSSEYPGNAETIEAPQLAELCAASPATNGTVFHAALPWMFDSAAPKTRFERKAASRAVAAINEIRYLVVITVDRYNPSTASGTDGLNPGYYAGSAALYRLEDGACLATVTVEGENPASATVHSILDRSGGTVSERDANLDLSVQSSRYFAWAIEGAFEAKGFNVKITL